MSTKNLLFIFSLSLLIFSISCGKKSSSSSSTKENKGIELNTVCDRLECLTNVDWKIVLQGQNFPERTKLIIDSETILDECLGKQQYTVNRNSAPESITLNYFKVPNGSINIKIIDQGWDCRSHSTFLEKRGASYELEKSNFAGHQLVINL